MRGKLRLFCACFAMLPVSLVLVPWLWLGRRLNLPGVRTAPRLWYRCALRALGWRLRHEGRMADARPLLIVANHVSWGDIVVLGALEELTFIAKSEVADWPVIGWLARLQRIIFVERERRNKAAAQAGEIAGRLDEHLPAVLFAEGTTGDGNHLLPFKSSLFGALALNKSAPVTVQPVSIAYTRLYGVPMGTWERNIASWVGERSLGFHLDLLSQHGPLDVELRWGEPLVLPERFDRKLTAASAESAIRTMMAAQLRQRPVQAP
jgi:lyso-ornithine lipid O-acyltransferase